MQLSSQGAIDIIGHEGICLTWYYDSVGVPTIGAGATRSDGIDPRAMADITLQDVIALFKRHIVIYTKAVDDENVYHDNKMTQFQYDALSSACYNFGAGNLHQLCRHRTLDQIGAALMLYTKPPEITGRRQGEQRLYQHGVYSNPKGLVNVFPVTVSRHPDYRHGHPVDIRPYFQQGATS